MRVMCLDGTKENKITRVLEITEAVVVHDEDAIYCKSVDSEAIIKFVRTDIQLGAGLSHAIHNLLTLGYMDFTYWDVYREVNGKLTVVYKAME